MQYSARDLEVWTHNFVVLQTNTHGMPIHRIEGKYLEQFKNSSSHYVIHPKVTTLQLGNAVGIVISCTATMEELGKDLVMNGDTRFYQFPETNSSVEIRSQQLCLSPKEKVAYTDFFTEIETNSLHSRSGYMNYNYKIEKAHATEFVSVEISDNGRRRAKEFDPKNVFHIKIS